MEQILPIVVGIIGLVIVWKAFTGIIKLIGIALVIAIVAALYVGAF